jgi:hypothetical protein
MSSTSRENSPLVSTVEAAFLFVMHVPLVGQVKRPKVLPFSLGPIRAGLTTSPLVAASRQAGADNVHRKTNIARRLA